MSTNTQSAIDKASSVAHSAIDDAARIAKGPMDRVTALAHEASDKAVDAKDRAALWLSESGERIAAPSRKMVSDASAYVSANPLKSVGIAALAALIIGRLMR